MDEANLPSLQKDNGDIPELSNFITEEPNACPLCNAPVMMFFINFREKMFMCVNTECDYPFGYEEVKIYNGCHNSDLPDDISSHKNRNTASVDASTISSAAWAELEQMTKLYEAEENQLVKKSLEMKDKNIKINIERDIQAQLNKNVANIRQLTKALADSMDNEGQCINNEKWLKNLMNKQTSGVKLLRQGEITKLKKTGSVHAAPELQINIDNSKNNVSSITINVTNL